MSQLRAVSKVFTARDAACPRERSISQIRVWRVPIFMGNRVKCFASRDSGPEHE